MLGIHEYAIKFILNGKQYKNTFIVENEAAAERKLIIALALSNQMPENKNDFRILSIERMDAI